MSSFSTNCPTVFSKYYLHIALSAFNTCLPVRFCVYRAKMWQHGDWRGREEENAPSWRLVAESGLEAA